MKTNYGFIPGRFQTPYLHAGHLHLIATALTENEEVVVLLGCQESFDERNPYNIKERTTMINRIFPQVDVVVLWDKATNEEWSGDVDIIINNITNGAEATLYHSRDGFNKQYLGNYPTKEVDEVEGYSATKLRNQL